MTLRAKSALARNKSALAIGAGMLLVAGLGVGYIATSGSGQGACDTAGSADCASLASVSTNLGAGTKAADKNACKAVALTFSAEAGAPAVSSNVFPAGTRLKITNLANGKSTTVPVTGISGSCALLNVAAMDQIRESGKNVVRNNTVEVVQGAAPANPAQPAQPAGNPPAGGGACNGVALTFSAEAGAPAVSSNVFPAGTRLKITNLANGKSTTVPVTGISGSCALLNVAAMDQIRESGKNVVRNNIVERLN